MQKERSYFVYVLASKKNGTLYIGITNNLLKRVLEHKEKLLPGFSSKYNVNMLVYYEVFQYVNDAIKRETILKTWKRKWKLELIEEKNKEWKDLFFEIFNEPQITAMKNYIMANSGNVT